MSVSGQYDMFSAMNADGNDSFGALHIDYPDIPELDIMERLGLEKEVAGIYLTGHPLERYSETAKAMNAVKTSEIAAAANRRRAKRRSCTKKTRLQFSDW